jgi:hypothetical protein
LGEIHRWFILFLLFVTLISMLILITFTNLHWRSAQTLTLNIHQLFLTTCSVSCWTQSVLNNTKHPWVKNLMHLHCCSIDIIKMGSWGKQKIAQCKPKL